MIHLKSWLEMITQGNKKDIIYDMTGK